MKPDQTTSQWTSTCAQTQKKEYATEMKQYKKKYRKKMRYIDDLILIIFCVKMLLITENSSQVYAEKKTR